MGNSFPELTKKRFVSGISLNDITAAVLYSCFAAFLYIPALGVNNLKIICGFNAVAAAWGAYFLSKRWISSWTPSLFAGVVYGFSPFALSFEMFHPLAGLSFVMVPWLLLPATFWHKGQKPDAIRFCGRALLSLLPFAGIVLLFWIPVQPWASPIFLMPKNLTLTAKDFTDLILPLHQSGGMIVFGIYHSALIFALMGLFVFIKLQRLGTVIPIAVGLILSFWEPIFQVTPVVWAAFPILFLSVLCGLGFQSLLCAGKADMKWVVICAAAASILAAFCVGIMMSPFAGRIFEITATMYGLTAAALWILLFMIKANLRWHWLKWTTLTAAITIDIIYSVVNELF